MDHAVGEYRVVVDDSATVADAPTEIPRAIPVSLSSTPLKPFLASPPVPEARQIFYSVTGIARGDTLNVRKGPGANNAITSRLPNGFNGIRILVGATVLIENVQIFGNTGVGIDAEPASGTAKLFIKDTTVHTNTAGGILLKQPAAAFVTAHSAVAGP